MEIQYPHDWYNVREKDSRFFLSENSSDGHSVGGIATGYYDGPRKLIRAINPSLAGIAVRQRVKLNYNDITQKVSVRMSPSTKFTTQGSMGVIIGLNTRTIRSPESHVPLDGDGVVYTFMKEGDSVFARKSTLNPTFQMAHWTRARPSTRCVPSTAKYTPFPQGPCRTRTKICSSVPYRNVWCYAVSITTRTTVRTIARTIGTTSERRIPGSSSRKALAMVILLEA